MAQRMGKGVKVEQWSNSDGEIGVAVTERSRARDGLGSVLYEIEMNPMELIELATDIMILARLKLKKESSERL